MARSVALPLLGATLLSLALVGACQDGPTEANGVARVQILLTDAPSDYLETAEVWISRVVLVPREDGSPEGPGSVDLFHDPQAPQWFDLLTLRDGITAELSELVEVPEGSYSQLRLVVDSARVTLRDGYTFRDGNVTRPLFVPSGAQSGIKVQLADPLEAEAGGIIILTVDFDVDRNFVMQGNPNTPAGILGFLFTPLLQEKERTGQR